MNGNMKVYCLTVSGDFNTSIIKSTYFYHPSAMREAFEAACRTMFGAEPAEMSLLYFLTYCRAAGGLPPLIEAKANSGQEFKVKVSQQVTLVFCVEKSQC